MAKKYFSWSFDDGLEQDKKITAILRKYGMGATFNLNSGLFGVRKYIGRISNLGGKPHTTKVACFLLPMWHLAESVSL